ncbi:uncharacterized protein LTR77_010034 [Saxophila tyrrhenica]|uniref:CHCH domain-containing protein n=1 Tax=Saxophila tyrrhenica TaxID=1690608 RepID=A0AAV9NXD3_9PEZI|nr:hypothetical protein LTR77_010034 [Saxophila tyrrhenica]
MPRQSRGPARSAPSRPTAASRPAPAPQPPQARQASTAAHPPAQAQQPQAQQGGGSGLFGQMASTAAGVAVGSSIGHAIGGMFGGGSSSAEAAPAAPADQPVAQQDNGAYAMNQNYQAPQMCATDVKNFRTCMDQNGGDLTICGWYMDQLKACQQAAQRY